jgi:hemerythrin-like domain-containing protein
MNAIALLKSDHQAVENLFKQYEKLSHDDIKQKSSVVKQMIELLSIHAFIEEQVFYPMVRAELEPDKDIVLESVEEHGIMKILLSDISNTNPKDERYDAKVKVLMDTVRHHVKEEESEMFPKASSALGRKRLDEVGYQMEEKRVSAPTSPPPGIGYVSKALSSLGPSADRMRQRGRGMMQKVVSAANKRASRSSAGKAVAKALPKPSRSPARKPPGKTAAGKKSRAKKSSRS